MVVKRPSEEDLAIHISNFGGLNTTASPISLPITDACRLLNVDTDINGDLKKRQGSIQLFDSNNSGRHDLTSFTSNFGVELLVAVYGQAIRVLSVNNDTTSTVFNFNSVFRFNNVARTFVAVPGDNARLLILSQEETPKQLQFYEVARRLEAGGASTTIKRSAIFYNQTVCDKAKVFVNGVLTDATVTYGATDITVTPTSYTLVTGDFVVVMLITWQWWAEAEFWYGSDFRYTVPRFGANEGDKLVTVPADVITDLNLGEPYGIYLYWKYNSLVLENQYTKVAVPSKSIEYAWSNGTYSVNPEYDLDTITQSFYSPNFVAFGAESNIVEYDNLELIDFSGTGNSIVDIPLHQFRTGDTVELIQTLQDLVSLNTTTHFVKVLSPDKIQLYTTAALTTPSTVTLDNIAANVASANIDVAGDFIQVTGGSISADWAGTCKVVADGLVMPGGVVYGRDYYLGVSNVSPGQIKLYFDKELKYVVDITSAAANCRVYTTRRILIRKKIYNSVTFNRARKIYFNGEDGVQAQNLDVELAGFFGLARNTNLASSTTGYALLTDANNLGTHVADNTTTGNYLLIVNSLGFDDTVIVVNKEPRWVGSNGQSNKFQEAAVSTHEGGYVPAYGFGRFANYGTGSFPSVAAFHQERLIFGGFRHIPGTIVSSALADYISSQFYNFFQITDALKGLDTEPFDVVLSDGSQINGILSWQQLLFVFTKENVYRSLNIQTILSPSNRALISISNTGLAVTNGTCTTGSDIYYLSNNGVYSVPIVFEGEYRSEEVSLKIRDVFKNVTFQGMHYHKERQKIWLYGTDRTFIYDVRTQSWTEYSSYVELDHTSVCDYYDNTNGWRVASNVSNVAFTGIIGWYADKFLDFVEYVPYASSPATLPGVIFEEIITNENQTEYKHDTFTEFIATVDYELWYGSNRASSTKLVAGTDWEKLSNNHFRINFIPTNAYRLYVIPRPAGSWYGWGMYLDNAPVYLTDGTFGTLDFDNTGATYSYDLSSTCLAITDSSVPVEGLLTIDLSDENCLLVAAESNAHIGVVYPTEYCSVAFAQNYLPVYKRVEEALCWFTQRRERFNASDYNSLGSFNLNLINSLKYPTVVSIAIIHNTSQQAAVEYDTLSQIADASMDEWILFRLRLQRLGYVYRLYITSSNVYSWQLTAYQIRASVMDGSGFISGGT